MLYVKLIIQFYLVHHMIYHILVLQTTLLDYLFHYNKDGNGNLDGSHKGTLSIVYQNTKGDLKIYQENFVSIVEINRAPNNHFDYQLIGDIADIYEELDTNKEIYNKFIAKKPLKDNAYCEIIKYYDLFKYRLLKLFESKKLI